MFPWTLAEEARIRTRLDKTVAWLRTADALLLPVKLAHKASKSGTGSGVCSTYRINVTAAEKLLANAREIGVCMCVQCVVFDQQQPARLPNSRVECFLCMVLPSISVVQLAASVPQVRPLNSAVDAASRWRHRVLEVCGPQQQPAPASRAASSGSSTIVVPGAVVRKVVTGGPGGAGSADHHATNGAFSTSVALLTAMKRGAAKLQAAAAKEQLCALTEARLYCVCHMPHVDGVFMVSCDACGEWCVSALFSACGPRRTLFSPSVFVTFFLSL